MPRQPYSEAVPSTGGRFSPSLLRREGRGEKGGAFFNGKEGRDDFRTPFFKGKEGFCPLQGEPKGSKRLLKVGFRKTSFCLKGGRGFQKCIPSNYPITY